MGILKRAKSTDSDDAVKFTLRLYDDKSTRERLLTSSAVEIMFSDARNIIPAEYFDTLQELLPGDSVEITIRRIPGG
jgi:hypothetical protein